MVNICRSVAGIRHKIAWNKNQGFSIGFVPTMGALHEGHKSLLDRAMEENDLVVCSIYANPTQFDNKEDLKKYPKTEQEDIALLQRANSNIAFIPITEDIYYNVKVKEVNYDTLTQSLEGAHRPGHFDGMTTIVRRLLEIVQPTNAYFGEKDFQQLAIIGEMVRREKMDVNIIGCPIVRESDGLAMSSRNIRLSAEERKNALILSQFVLGAHQEKELLKPKDVENKGLEAFKLNHLKPDYVKIVEANSLESAKEFLEGKTYRVLVAAYSGSTRLIDNAQI